MQNPEVIAAVVVVLLAVTPAMWVANKIYNRSHRRNNRKLMLARAKS